MGHVSGRRVTAARHMTFLALTGAYVAFWLYVFWPRLGFAMFEGPYSGYGLDTLLQPAIRIGVGLAATVLWGPTR